MVGQNYAFRNASGSEWSRTETQGQKYRVLTSKGIVVDFYSRNFDVKHILVMSNATDFNVIKGKSMARRDARATGTLNGHDGAAVSGSGTNSLIALTSGALAAWGGDIAEKQATAPAVPFSSYNKALKKTVSVNQYYIQSEILSAGLVTSSKGGNQTSGIHATVMAVVERTAHEIFVVHFEAKHTSTHKSMTLSSGSGSAHWTLTPDTIAKRNERFKKANAAFDPDIYDGVGSLFG